MYNIKKLNAISSVVYDFLPKETFNVSSHHEDADTDAYIVRSASCHEIDFSSRTLAIARAGAGVNNIPLEKCANQGIVAFNTPGANANAVKELVLAGLLIASRNVVEAAVWAQGLKGQGEEVPKLVEKGKKNFVGPELKGKTLGVIGLGAIGAMVANSATAIGMRVVGYDPFISVDSAWSLSSEIVRAINLDDVLKQSDYITIHVPLMDKTRDFISSPEFSKMKDGVVIVNFARNGIIKKSSLFEAIESGKVSKFVTDFPDDDMLGRQNIIAIPHLGASTPESEENCAMMAAKEIRDFIEHGSIVNSVNMPDCKLEPTDKHRVSVIHKNLPNMVGQVTTAIANDGVNISDMVNKSKGDMAYSALDIDAPATDSIINALNAIEGVIRVRIIK